MSGSDFLKETKSLMTGFWLTDLANFSALVFQNFVDVNWAGFYLSDSKILRLGPFCGKPACTEIAFNRGVCGAAYSKNEIMIVKDVHQFAGHIACDTLSRSELVIPLRINENIIGVFDVDSPKLARFSAQDAEILKTALDIVIQKNPGLNLRTWNTTN